MEKTKILLATHNKAKASEMYAPFHELGYELQSLDSLEYTLDAPEETGKSFEENALLKARFVANKTGCIALADDSGLEVKALKGMPGIYSARYTSIAYNTSIEEEKGMTSQEKDALNIRTLLSQLGDNEERAARFVSCLALVFPHNKGEIIAHGFWNGFITYECRGNNGFGYDPIFFDLYKLKTAAEMTKEEKTQISHRAKALKNLLTQMKNITL